MGYLQEFDVVPDVSTGMPQTMAVHEGADTVCSSVRPMVRVYVPAAPNRVIIFGAPDEQLTKHGSKPSIPMCNT